MAIGDGIRRNLATISVEERNRFREAIRALDMTRAYPDGVSFWDKQDQIHQVTHSHGGPSFIPWHRELCNRFEALIREVDKDLSLHYWDWTTDPRDTPDGVGGTVNLFTDDFMGSSNGRAGGPLETFDNNGVLAGSRDQTADPADPPREVTRDVGAGLPEDNIGSVFRTDAELIATGDLLPQDEQWPAFRQAVEDMHGLATAGVHGYIGGTIGQAHSSFEDPFVFLLHSNVDRLFAMWQSAPGKAWRLDPAQVYGSEKDTVGNTGIKTLMEPWAGGSGIRPWAPPENQIVAKDCRHPSVVAPPCYDTMPNVPATIVLDTAAINFNDVPVGEKTVRPVVFTVYACQAVSFVITDGPKRLTGPASTAFETPLGEAVVVPHAAGYTVPKAYVWISFRGTAAGDMATGEVTVHCNENGQDYVIPITTNTIARPKAVVALVLDRSNSMSYDGGDGRTRLQVLKDAAHPFIDVLQMDNAVGMVAFDHDPHDVFPVTVVGDPEDATHPARGQAHLAITNHTHNPQGNTAIGDGVEKAHQLLDPVAGYDVKAMIVLTDGQETASKYISEVSALIDPNQHIFAIGLGTPEGIRPAALAALAHGHRGTLRMTGMLNQDSLFLLTKFYQQILAEVTNEDIVEDPEGFVLPGQVHRIPFRLNEADISTDVLLFSPAAGAFRFTVETPGGQIIDPGVAAGGGGMAFRPSNLVSFYRLTLPALVGGVGARSGLWHAILSVDERLFKRYLASLENQRRLSESARANGLRYSVNVHAYSSLRMRASLTQNSYEPGAALALRAVLTEYDLPVAGRATAWAELERPDRTRSTVTLSETDPGVFEAAVPATLAGVYQFRVRAAGSTLRGRNFTRERSLTGVTWKGGDDPLPTPGRDPRPRDEQICELLECLVSDKTLGRFLKDHKIDPGAILKCLSRFCGTRRAREGGRHHAAAPVEELRRLLANMDPGSASEVLGDLLRKVSG